MALNVVRGRDIPVILSTLPFFPIVSLPSLPSGSPHQDHSSSSISQSSSSSASLVSTSESTSSSTSVSTSFSTTSSTIPPSTSSEPPLGTATPIHTVTAIASDASQASPSSSSIAGPPHTGFLQNKVLSGVVFGIAGLVGLVLLILLATFAIRRRKNNKLMEDAVSFDPVKMGNYHNAMESGLGEKVRASVSTGHVNDGPEVRQSPAFIDYAPPASRSYLPPSSNMPSYASSSQGQYNVTGTPYVSPHDWDRLPQQHSSQPSSTDLEFAHAHSNQPGL